MSRRKDSSDRDPAADRRDPVLRLAVAATALGMTMGIAPATVLGAGETEAAAPAAAATTDGAARKPDAVHLKITRERQSSGTQSKPDAAIHKDSRPDACCVKFPIPENEASRSVEAKQPAASGQPVKPGYDVATTKK
ncbi:MAG: hypothetical protein IPI06_06070 [Gammaproteobacteria bacterium]|nr:hypothetical protein [Gammaproteobacteria bacterium]